MSSEFILYTLPACEITSPRIGILKQHLGALADELIADIASDEGDADYSRERIEQAIDWLTEINDRRDVAEYYVAGMPYVIWTTGGYSWGDFPTDAACEFTMLADCPSLLALLEQWAKQDLDSRLRTEAQSHHSGEQT
jgi:hypothetical protein